ncbi:MAG TPA: serine/threonine-protein kinase [Kofleriaceae bacterium]|nr:serine/threonine-protein kinase [Kofleriaceae bacterium]
MQALREVTVTDARHHSPGPCLVGEPIAPGSTLAGRYRIKRFVAAGGMGEVYEADDQLLGDPVAVKLLRADLMAKPGAQARFADEIRLARRVTHANVCRVFDVGTDGDRVFYTMELHAGETLKAHLATRGCLSIGEIQPIVRQLLAGIGAAHAADVIHADLKPSNVLIGANNRVVVTDFGLALPCCATLGCACDMPHLIGTPAYMAPEQVTGGTILEGTDLFSFGVIVYELLTGDLPWHGATPLELAHARLTGEPPSMRARRAEIDATWDDVVRNCLRVDITQRPKSAAAIATALSL